MDKLSYYPPSNAMLQNLKVNFNDRSLIAGDAHFEAYLNLRQLDYDNVCGILKTLLNIEDISTMHNYSQLMEHSRIVQIVEKNLYRIHLTKKEANVEEVLTADLDELVLVPKASLLASPYPKEIILAQMPHIHEDRESHDEERRYVGTITEVKPTSITFKCPELTHIPDKSTFKKNIKRKYDIIFRSQRIPYRLMYRALKVLMNSRIERRYLFPVHNDWQFVRQTNVATKLEVSSLLNASIAGNIEQLQAVQQIVAGPTTQAPYIIFGPPGTGKTTTIVEAILQLYLRKKGRIIVTAGSNSACDTIALRLCECIENDPRFKTKDNEPNKVLIRLISERRFRKAFKTMHPLILRNSNCWSMKKIVYKTMKTKVLKSYGIIVATLCKVGILALTNGIKISYVFIDEAAASSEPEALLGIMGIKDSECCIILSGDHKQLGAVIKNKRASSLGLGHSLMERLLLNKIYEMDANGHYDTTLQTRLRRNYRSHPAIVGLYNKLYYNNELIPLAPLEQVDQAANWEILSNGKFPVLFQVVHGTTTRESSSKSRNNEVEANVLCWYVQTLLKKGLGSGIKVSPEDIGVITPYLAQCRLLTRMLRQRGQSKVEVGSVESYQGREKPIIIVSLVSSFTSTAFVSDPRRLNVILSRPKSLLILIGNSISLRCNDDFRFIIDQCTMQGNNLSKKNDKIKKKKKFQNEETILNNMKNLSLDKSKVICKHLNISKNNQN